MFCALYLCESLTNLYYSVLVEMVCSIQVLALYVGIEFVLLLCSLTFLLVLEWP